MDVTKFNDVKTWESNGIKIVALNELKSFIKNNHGNILFTTILLLDHLSSTF